MRTYRGLRSNPITWLTPFMLLGLLLFPSTCADAAMVHSIFTDPTALTQRAINGIPNTRHMRRPWMTEIEFDPPRRDGSYQVVRTIAGSEQVQSARQFQADPCLPHRNSATYLTK